MECYLTIKKKEILPFLSTWMELQDIKLSISNNLIKLLFFFFSNSGMFTEVSPWNFTSFWKTGIAYNNDAFPTSLWKQLAGSEVLSTYRESSSTFYSSHPACFSHSRCLIDFQSESGSVIGSVLTNCEPMDCSLPGSHVHGPWWALSLRISVDSLGN